MAKKIKNRKYSWRESRRFGGDPQEVGEYLESLRQQHEGRLRPEDIVHDAEDVNSPLHRYFEWDDDRAAHNYRLNQARSLVQALVVSVEYKNTEVEGVVAFVSEKDDEGQAYSATFEVLSDKDRRSKLIDQAIIDLENIRARLRMFEEASSALDSIDDAVTKLKKNRRKKKASASSRG